MMLEEKALIRTQAISGLLFGAFLLIHLANTLVGTGGQSAYDGFQTIARGFYQNPVFEISAVCVAAIVHAWAGIVRWRRRRAALRARGSAPRLQLRVRLHRWAGYYLLAMFGGHFLATRGAGWLLGKPVDFSYLNFSLSHWAWAFYPYYALLGLGGLFHLAHGSAIALKVLGVRLPAWVTAPRSKPFWVATAVAGLGICAGISSMGGAWRPVDQGRHPEFRALYERILPRALLPWH